MNIYVVQNQEGKFFRNIGYGGYGKSWRDKLEDAKFYTKIGQAKSRVTFWFKKHPEYGCPKILVFSLGVANMTVLDMEEDTRKAIAKIHLKEKQKELYNLDFYYRSQVATHKGRTREDILKEIDELKKKVKSL